MVLLLCDMLSNGVGLHATHASTCVAVKLPERCTCVSVKLSKRCASCTHHSLTHTTHSLQGGPAGAPASGGADGAGALDFLRNNSQFQMLRQLVQSNPQILQPMLQVGACWCT